MKLFLLIDGDGVRIDVLEQIILSGGMILHRDTVPLKIETDELYSAMLDKDDLSEVTRLWKRARDLMAEGRGLPEEFCWQPELLSHDGIGAVGHTSVRSHLSLCPWW